MVLELVYSNDERRVAQSTLKQIWDILYKDTVAPDVMQTEGGEDDIPERERILWTRTTCITVRTPLILVNPKGMILCTRPRVEGERRGMTKGVPRTRWLGILVW